jgi:acyl-CoA synthetase (AMP-forming)/AMP-acid ligase II
MSTLASPVYTCPLPAPAVEPSVPVAALRHAAADPTAPAVIDGATAERLTRGELAARSASLAAGLRARGVGRGDLVAVAMPNLAWWPVVAMGVWRTSAAIALVSPLWTADETARVLGRAVPRLAIAFAPLAGTLRAGLDAVGLPDVELVAAGGEAPGATPIAALMESEGGDPFAEPDLGPDDLAAVPFSSGTSGLPKGVRLTHGNLAAAGEQGISALSCGGIYDAHSVVLAGAPFFHSIGLTLMLCGPLRLGATIVTLPRPMLEPLLELVAAHRVTHMAVPPPLFDALAADPGVDYHDLSSLRVVVTGGAHMHPEVEQALSARLACIARQGYGATEATCTIAAPLLKPSTPATVGWPMPGTELRLVDPETGADAEPGQPGELYVRGPQVMQGYHADPEATAAAMTPDGWLRTGDLISIREDGQLEVRDRLKELIKVKGASVAPAEIELVLRQHPAVHDAGVIGVPDLERGEAPIAFVSLDVPADPRELEEFAAARLAHYKRPRKIVVIDEVPRVPTGKLARRALRERALALA